LISIGYAIKYAEPENDVVSRLGDKCVVALTYNWYIKYGDEYWKNKVIDHVENNVDILDSLKNGLFHSLEWLKEYKLSKNSNLGNKIQWDQISEIDSKSTSTISNAFSTISHILTKNNEVNPKDLTAEVFDYIFLDKDEIPESNIPKELLLKMKNEFQYWYPVDIKFFSKDLISYDLSMYLYNHIAIFNDNKFPKSLFSNGKLLINGVKMPREIGKNSNLDQLINNYSSDAIRIALADSGDSLDDANFETHTSQIQSVKLYQYIHWTKQIVEEYNKIEKSEEYGMNELILIERMKELTQLTYESYKKLKFRDSLKYSWFEFQKLKDDYRVDSESKMNLKVLMEFIEIQTIIMEPITPHISNYIWRVILKKEKMNWPKFEKIDHKILSSKRYFNEQLKLFRKKLQKETFQKKKIPNKAIIHVSRGYSKTQKEVLEIMRNYLKENPKFSAKEISKEIIKKFEKNQINEIMKFVNYIGIEYERYSYDALNDTIPFDELNILKEYENILLSELSLKEIIYYYIDDTIIIDPENRIPLVSFGRPQITFIRE
jgi:leucyl-tRNA synthetase